MFSVIAIIILIVVIVFFVSLNREKKENNDVYECNICDENDCICEKKDEED